MTSRTAPEVTPPAASPVLPAGLMPRASRHYHVFVASPGDVNDERNAVRAFFKSYNVNYAEPRGLHFEVVDWENYSSAGVGRPQELITKQTLERYRDSLALVVGIMAQRFGSKSGTHESGTEEEFEWAVAEHAMSGFPEVKWFFRDVEKLALDPTDPEAGIEQWKKVQAFRKLLDTGKSVFFKSYKDLKGFQALLDNDVGRWLSDPERPWFRPGPEPAPAALEWPQDAVEALARQLEDEFSFHMQAGEALSAEKARARYVPEVLKVRATSPDASAPKKGAEPSRRGEGPLQDFVASDGVQLLVIGGGGTGKTTMLRHLAAEGTRRAAENSRAPIFVFLRLTAFDRNDGGLDLLLDRLSLAAHLDRRRFEAVWRQGRRPVVFLLDGLNEVAQDHRPSCIAALSSALEGSSPVHRYVITSRPGGELEVLAGRSTENRRLQIADIQKFDPERIQQYLVAQGRTELQARISGRIEQLASNPFLLWAITRTLTTVGQGNVKNRGALFEALIDRYIFGEREQSKPKPRPTDYNYALVKKPVLAQLAFRMLNDGVTVVADSKPVWELVAKCLKELDLQREKERVLPLEEEVFMPEKYAAVSFLREAIENGVIVRDADGLRFMHESVQEYFSAVALSASSIDEVERIVPSIELAYLDARGPKFETLVTWAGLVGPEKVAELVVRLHSKHPLLAGHVAAEAGLREAHVEPLRQMFLEATRSDHEQRRRLGAEGLAILPSGDSDVLARLIELLEDVELGDAARRALRAIPTHETLSAVVRACSARPADQVANGSKLLREIVSQQGAAVAETLLDTWMAEPARRGRVAELAAAFDARYSWEPNRRSFVREALLTLAVDAELAGDRQRSEALDELRKRAEQVVATPPWVPPPWARWGETLGQASADRHQRDELSSGYTEKDDATLQVIVRDGEPLQRLVALDVLVRRGSPTAVPPLVSSILAEPSTAAFRVLESLPRELVERDVADRIGALEGTALERARLVLGLFSDRPQRNVLEHVFQSCAPALREIAARAAARGGREGVELLVGKLKTELDQNVLEACVETLGASRDDAALSCLVDLLVDRTPRGGWAYVDDDDWGEWIHDVLVRAGAADEILLRLRERMRAPHAGDVQPVTRGRDRAIWIEVSRWIPDPRAFELLRWSMSHNELEPRCWAQWLLARVGDPEAWKALLQTGLDAPPEFMEYAQDAATCLATIPAGEFDRDRLIAVSASVLRPPPSARAPGRTAACHSPQDHEQAARRMGRRDVADRGAVDRGALTPLG